MTPCPARRRRRWFPLAVCLVLPATPSPRLLDPPRAVAGPMEPVGSPAARPGTALASLPSPAGERGAPTAARDGTGLPAAAAVEPPRVVTVRRGDTLAEILHGAGIDRADAQAALAALTEAFPARALQPGHVLTLRPDPTDEARLLGIAIEPEPGRRIRAVRTAGATGHWVVAEDRTDAARRLVLAQGEVQTGTGLVPSLQRAGLPTPLALSLVRLLGHEVDFQRDLQPGDRFAVLFDRFRDAAEGNLLREGDLVHVALTPSGRRLAWWRHRTAEGEEAWFDAAGRSLSRGLMRTPLDGARLSSRFGSRAHPILGFTRMHQGVDFAAPAGTPVYAAADGIVAEARVQSGYGRTIVLRHGSGPDAIETLYAHLSAFARGLKPGSRVRQGEVIGRVGASGLATGPHLHYEVRVAGKPVDPAGPVATARDRLTGPALVAFQRAREAMEVRLAGLAPFQEVAWAE